MTIRITTIDSQAFTFFAPPRSLQEALDQCVHSSATGLQGWRPQSMNNQKQDMTMFLWILLCFKSWEAVMSKIKEQGKLSSSTWHINFRIFQVPFCSSLGPFGQLLNPAWKRLSLHGRSEMTEVAFRFSRNEDPQLLKTLAEVFQRTPSQVKK